MSTLAVRPFMHALPATAAPAPEASAAVPVTASAVTPAAGQAGAVPTLSPADPAPWLYRSEGFAEDLESELAHEPKPDSPLLRWGLPAMALVGVVGLAAAFSLV